MLKFTYVDEKNRVTERSSNFQGHTARMIQMYSE